jgi:hypothetical protein
MNTRTVTIPKTFYRDHLERCGKEETPRDHSKSKTCAIINVDDPNLIELISDARYYGDPDMSSELWQSYRGLVMSARATLKAIDAALGAGGRIADNYNTDYLTIAYLLAELGRDGGLQRFRRDPQPSA